MTSLRTSTFAVLQRVRQGPGWGLGRFRVFRALHHTLQQVSSRIERSLGDHPVQTDAFGLLFFVAPDDRQVGAELLRNGSYEPEETRLFQAYVGPGMTVVDVGANVGVYTLLAARNVGDAGRVVAFEPEPETLRLLVRNVVENGFTNATAVQKAVSASAGRAELFTVAGHPGLASLSKGNARGSADRVTVQTVTLDEVLEQLGVGRVHVLKLDVQGAELDVLLGARSMLSNSRPLIFFEYWPAGLRNVGHSAGALLTHLEDFGYRFSRISMSAELLDAAAVERRVGGDGGDLIARPLDETS